MAFAAFADAPVDVAVVEVGMGGTWDATNVADAQVAVDHADRPRPHRTSSARRVDRDRRREGRHHQAGCVRRARPAAGRGRRGAAAPVRRGRRHRGPRGPGVRRRWPRTLAVGGQLLSLRGLAGEYDDIFLPLLRRPPGAQRGRARSPRSRRSSAAAHAERGPLDLDLVRAAFAAVTSPGRLEVVRSSPTVVLDAAHNPAGARATAEAVGSPSASPGWSASFAAMADKDVRGMLEALEPVLAEVVVTQSTSGRAMPADELAAIAVEVFGADRVEVAPRLDDAHRRGDRAGRGGGRTSAARGVLVTGSIITVGEARTLLGGS